MALSAVLGNWAGILWDLRSCSLKLSLSCHGLEWHENETESQDRRMIWVGREPSRPPGPTLAMCRDAQSSISCSSLTLDVCTSPGSPCQCLTALNISTICLHPVWISLLSCLSSAPALPCYNHSAWQFRPHFPAKKFHVLIEICDQRYLFHS